MDKDDVVEIMSRELLALGQYYRNDWSGFDGRTLRAELNSLVSWAEDVATGKQTEIFTSFSTQLQEQEKSF